MSLAVRHADYADLARAPDDRKWEVVHGALVALPAPLPRHLKVQGTLRTRVGGPFDDDDGYGGPGGWWIFLEAEVRLERHVIVRPDLVGFRRERLPQPDVRPFDLVPDWVCEVLSPSNAAHDRVTKRALYSAPSVPYYWLVDPDARTLEALRLEAGRWVELGAWDDTMSARIEPFEAVELPIGRLFLPKPPSDDGLTPAP